MCPKWVSQTEPRMAYRLPAHLHRNRYGTLYFRLVIPTDLCAAFGQSEIYRSLRTASVREATIAAQAYTIAVRRLFSEMRGMDPTRLKDLVLRKKHELELADVFEQHEAELASLKRKAMQVGRYAYEKGRAEAVDGQRAILAALESSPTRPAPKIAASPLLADAINAFIEEKTTRSRWTPKTLEKKQLAFRLFLQFMGERLGQEPRMDKIDKQACVAFLALLQKLPPNMTKNHSGRPLSDVAALGLAPMASATINGITGLLSGLFDWCKENPAFKIDHNPAYRLAIDETPTKKLRTFKDDELVALFSSPSFTSRTFLHSYHYWIIPLALHTGARLGELCQLSLADFVEVDGIPCIHINDEEEKRLKNRNSKRLVPIHSCLIDLGLLRHVEAMRLRGATRLFPEIDLSISASHDASNWFNDKRRYSDSCGVSDPDTNFHSFRRTFITRTIKKTGGGGADPHDVALIVGHEHGLITMDVYFDSSVDAAERRATIEKFQLPSVVQVLIAPVEQVTFGKRPPRRVHK